MLRLYVGITDFDWFRFLQDRPHLAEVNFWQPGGERIFRALRPGELFLFKLHSPRDYIVGGGVFAHATILPVSLAWATFGEANGAASLAEMRARLARYRRAADDRRQDYRVGCIVLEQPFFLAEDLWLPAPPSWRPQIVQGKGFDAESAEGAALWRAAAERLAASAHPAALQVEAGLRYGAPRPVAPRLGQGAFRLGVLDAYGRRCAATGERVLPALEAGHIRPYAQGGGHEIPNGLLLRRDLHSLFDAGYVTVTPAQRLEVSRRLREEFENGRAYYALHGGPVRVPNRSELRPAREALAWHNENVFLG